MVVEARVLLLTVQSAVDLGDGFRWEKLTFLVTINPLNMKRRLLYLKTQSVPRSKHFSSQL